MLTQPLLSVERQHRSPPATSADEPMSVEVIARSFAFMEYRKMRRLLFGLYPEKGRITLFWAFAYCAVLCVLVGLSWTDWRPSGLRLHWEVDDVIFGSIFTLITLFTVTRTVDVIRYCLYWAYVAVMVLLITDNMHVEDASPDTPTQPQLHRWLLLVLIGLEVGTLISWYLIHCVMPSAVLWLVSRADLRLWWHIEPLPADGDGGPATYKFRYSRRPWGLRVGRGLTCVTWKGGAVHVCSYRGGRHAVTGRPHGYGEWVDDSYHGECLRGFWSDGLPVGPFSSREFGSGYAFVSVQLGYVCNHDDPNVDGSFIVRRRAAAPLRMGIAAVECSVSGQHFRDFPHVQIQPVPAEPAVSSTRAAPGACGGGARRASAPPPTELGQVVHVSMDWAEAEAEAEAAAEAEAEAMAAAADWEGGGGGAVGAAHVRGMRQVAVLALISP